MSQVVAQACRKLPTRVLCGASEPTRMKVGTLVPTIDAVSELWPLARPIHEDLEPVMRQILSRSPFRDAPEPRLSDTEALALLCREAL
jgi:hypothetical protein